MPMEGAHFEILFTYSTAKRRDVSGNTPSQGKGYKIPAQDKFLNVRGTHPSEMAFSENTNAYSHIFVMKLTDS